MRAASLVDRQEGVAMLLAIVAVLLLAVAVLDTRAAVNLFERIALSTAQEIQTDYLARSGLGLVKAALEDDSGETDSYDDDWAAANDAGAIPVGDIGWVIGKVEDEAGKLNVNLLVRDGEVDEFRSLSLLTLLQAIGLSTGRAEEIVQAVIDRLDERTFRTVGEMALIEEIGTGLLYRGEGETAPLSRFLTVFGDLEGTNAGRVNVNTAPVEVLMALTPDDTEGVEYFIDRDLAEDIVESRTENPFANAADLEELVGQDLKNQLTGQPVNVISFSSSYFSADIVGETDRASSRAFGVFHRQGDGTAKLVYYRGF